MKDFLYYAFIVFISVILHILGYAPFAKFVFLLSTIFLLVKIIFVAVVLFLLFFWSDKDDSE